jgi:hypothetical protein
LFLLSFAFGRVIIVLEASRSNFLISILKYGLKIMHELLYILLGVIVVIYSFLTAREHFSIAGQEIITFTPDTCDPSQDLDTGLCYIKCKHGYHGVGPVCWADSKNIGVGTPVGLEPCPDGWHNDGLICREPIGCHSIGDCFLHGKCGCWGGRLQGRLNHGGICPGPGGGDDHTERIDGLCYKKCPKELPNHIPGMPYLCYIGGDLSYGRGVGSAPYLTRLFGKYPFLKVI